MSFFLLLFNPSYLLRIFLAEHYIDFLFLKYFFFYLEETSDMLFYFARVPKPLVE